VSTQVWSDDGAKDSLNLYLRTGGQGLDTYKVCLYKQNLALTKDTTLAQLLAAEAAFPGYSRLTLSYANWPAAVATAHVAQSTYSVQLSWTCTGGGTTESEYGWWIMDPGATKWIAADKFPAGPYVMLSNGDNISGSITLTSQSHN